MKKLLLAFLLIVPMASAFADDNSTPAAEPCADGNCFVSAKYVKGAYDAVKSEKIGTTITNTMNGSVIANNNIPSGSVITSIDTTTTTVNNKTVTTGLTINRSNVQLPVGNSSATNYATVWIE